jgi:hypothetical protein
MEFIVDGQEGVYPFVRPGAPLGEMDLGPMETTVREAVRDGDDPFSRSFS